MSVQEPFLKRSIRSFVRREGRMSIAQKRAWQEQWSYYGIDWQSSKISLDAIFQRQAPRFVEIGFGRGDSLLAQALANPDYDYLGIEVYRTGIGALLHQCQECNIKNVRIICHDAVEVFQTMLEDQQCDGIMVFFPDPWPKKRHHKRRLLQANNLRLFTKKLKATGYLHIATDWQEYAEAIEQEAAKVTELRPMLEPQAKRLIQERAHTKYERRGQQLGHTVVDLVYLA